MISWYTLNISTRKSGIQEKKLYSYTVIKVIKYSVETLNTSYCIVCRIPRTKIYSTISTSTVSIYYPYIFPRSGQNKHGYMFTVLTLPPPPTEGVTPILPTTPLCRFSILSRVACLWFGHPAQTSDIYLSSENLHFLTGK